MTGLKKKMFFKLKKRGVCKISQTKISNCDLHKASRVIFIYDPRPAKNSQNSSINSSKIKYRSELLIVARVFVNIYLSKQRWIHPPFDIKITEQHYPTHITGCSLNVQETKINEKKNMKTLYKQTKTPCLYALYSPL